VSEVLDRRLVAVMFTDMVGYTALVQANERLGLDKRDRYVSAIETHHDESRVWSSQCAPPGRVRWLWQCTSPGTMVAPDEATISTAGPISSSASLGRIQTTRLLSTRTLTPRRGSGERSSANAASRNSRPDTRNHSTARLAFTPDDARRRQTAVGTPERAGSQTPPRAHERSVPPRPRSARPRPSWRAGPQSPRRRRSLRGPARV
jgi:hypothetical protein